MRLGARASRVTHKIGATGSYRDNGHVYGPP